MNRKEDEKLFITPKPPPYTKQLKLKILETLKNISPSINLKGYSNYFLEEAQAVLVELDRAMKINNTELIRHCLRFFYLAYFCKIEIQDSKQLILQISTERTSLANIDTIFLKDLLEIYVKNTGIAKHKHQIEIAIWGDKNVPHQELLTFLKNYYNQINVLMFSKYTALNDRLLSEISNNAPYLKSITISIAKSITSKGLSYLRYTPYLKEITLEDCSLLSDLSLNGFPALETLHIFHCNSMERIRLHNMVSLQSIDVDACDKVKTITMERLKHISNIRIWGCDKLVRLVGLQDLQELKTLCLTHCRGLRRINIGGLLYLEYLHLEALNGAKNIKLHDLIRLKTARILDCLRVKTLKPINVPELQALSIGLCYHLQSIDLKGSTNLLSVNISLCSDLKRITGLKKLRKLNLLDIHKCDSIKKLDIQHNESIEELLISFCHSINALTLSGLKRLNRLKIEKCNNLKILQGLDELDKLQKLDLIGNKNLKKWTLGKLLEKSCSLKISTRQFF